MVSLLAVIFDGASYEDILDSSIDLGYHFHFAEYILLLSKTPQNLWPYHIYTSCVYIGILWLLFDTKILDFYDPLLLLNW